MSIHHKQGCFPAYGKTCNACRRPNHFASVCQAEKREVQAVDQEGASDEQAFLICALSTYVQKYMQRRKWQFELNTKRGPLETSDFGKIGENHLRAGDNGENCPIPWRLAILVKMAIVAKLAISAKTARGLVISRNVANIQIGCQKWPLKIR